MHSLADAPDSSATGPTPSSAPALSFGLRRLDNLALSGCPLWERNVRGSAPIPSFLFLGPKLDQAPRRLALITGPSDHDNEAVEGLADVMESLAANPEPATGSTLYLYPSAIHGRLGNGSVHTLRHGAPHQNTTLLLAEEFRRLRFHAWLRVLRAPHIRAPQIRFGEIPVQPIAEDLVQHLQTQFNIQAVLGHGTPTPAFGSRSTQPTALGVDLRYGDSMDVPGRALVAAVIHRWISLNRVLDASHAPGSAQPDSPFFH